MAGSREFLCQNFSYFMSLAWLAMPHRPNYQHKTKRATSFSFLFPLFDLFLFPSYVFFVLG
jgi:hypothetical protein